MLRVLDLFSGIGGFSLGLERAGLRTVAFCEIDPYCRKVLARHWPGVPCYDDVTTLTAAQLPGPVDVICGGFPCQDISTAGKGAGITGERSGTMEASTPELLARYDRATSSWRTSQLCLRRGLADVLGDLAALGYDAEWHCIPASAVGAPHRRDRVWIVAYAARELLDGSVTAGPGRRRQSANGSSDMADPDQPRLAIGNLLAGIVRGTGSGDAGQDIEPGRSQFSDADGQPPGRLAIAWGECGHWLVEPDVGGSPDGFPSWLVRCVGRGLNYAESGRRSEVLRKLWSDHLSQTLRRTAGGLERIQQAEVLFAFVREYEGGTNEARLLVAGQEASETFLRGLRECAMSGSPSRRSGQDKQRADEYPDTVQSMSRFLACDGQAHWAGGGWEDAVPRVASGVPNRVDRLKSLGNAVVPQIPELIGRAIMAQNQSLTLGTG